MANVVLFTNNSAQYLKSVNTPDYTDNPNALINPDVSALTNVPLKFWKRVGGAVVEMTAGEKQSVLSAETLDRKKQADTMSISDMRTVLTALIKVINIRLPNGQKITASEMIQALKDEIN